MRSLISEFSYGFALTHELVLSLGPLVAAPILPSLIEEGRSGGGYDVKLEAPGIPLFLQFKRSERLSRSSAREIKAGAPLGVPFFRVAITARRDSDQHDMLLELDEPPNIVLYAAPMFHLKEEFDDAFLAGAVRNRSFFVRPGDIGYFDDDGAHHISFDGATFVVMSKPRVIPGLGASELADVLMSRLEEEPRSLRQVLPEALGSAERARLASRRYHKARADAFDQGVPYLDTSAPTALELFLRRQARALPPVAPPPDVPAENMELRRLADIGLREFNAQLYIVQRSD